MKDCDTIYITMIMITLVPIVMITIVNPAPLSFSSPPCGQILSRHLEQTTTATQCNDACVTV